MYGRQPAIWKTVTKECPPKRGFLFIFSFNIDCATYGRRFRTRHDEAVATPRVAVPQVHEIQKLHFRRKEFDKSKWQASSADAPLKEPCLST